MRFFDSARPLPHPGVSVGGVVDCAQGQAAPKSWHVVSLHVARRGCVPQPTAFCRGLPIPDFHAAQHWDNQRTPRGLSRGKLAPAAYQFFNLQWPPIGSARTDEAERSRRPRRGVRSVRRRHGCTILCQARPQPSAARCRQRSPGRRTRWGALRAGFAGPC